MGREAGPLTPEQHVRVHKNTEHGNFGKPSVAGHTMMVLPLSCSRT